MDDKQIIDLYWARSENAITETAKKYGRFCHSIAYNILSSHEDSEECVNDTYLNAWNAIPPKRPRWLSAFLGKLTRNLALKKYEKDTAAKRGGGQMALALEELAECIPAPGSLEKTLEDHILTDKLNVFLAQLSPETRSIFLRRYWQLCSVQEIAETLAVSESKVKMSLMRTRRKLRNFLEQEGIEL